MSLLSPATIIAQVSRAVPADCREHIIIIGSLAAGYHFFGHEAPRAIRTKDIDCVLEPREVALEKGTLVAEKLLAAGWTQKTTGKHAQPGKASDATDQLPAVRLYPPRHRAGQASDWFIELLTVPDATGDAGISWMRLPLSAGHFGLPSFRFLRFTAFLPREAGLTGLRYARPQMMALANLMEHPRIKADTMSEPFAGRAIKRSNKDLGRVLALAFLSGEREVAGWGMEWVGAFRKNFPAHWRKMAAHAGDGLRELLASHDDLEEAHYTCLNGLLATHQVSLAQLREAGAQLIRVAMKPLEAEARRATK